MRRAVHRFLARWASGSGTGKIAEEKKIALRRGRWRRHHVIDVSVADAG
jgi:hypothetical protein